MVKNLESLVADGYSISVIAAALDLPQSFVAKEIIRRKLPVCYPDVYTFSMWYYNEDLEDLKTRNNMQIEEALIEIPAYYDAFPLKGYQTYANGVNPQTCVGKFITNSEGFLACFRLSDEAHWRKQYPFLTLYVRQIV